MQAIVLAGGLGTRLRGTIGDLPKPMAPVDGAPFLEHLLAALERQGIVRVVLSVGFRHEVIERHFGNAFGALAIEYAIESEPLGTGGAMRCALEQAEPGPCFVLNGDTFVAIDLRAMHDDHATGGAPITMAVIDVEDVSRFGALDVEAGIVRAFVEKGSTGAGAINAGLYLIERNLFDPWPLPPRFSFETDFLRPHLATLAPRAFRARGPFIDIGVPEDYRAATDFMRRLAR